MNVQIAQYFHFVAFRDSMKYVPLMDHSFVDVIVHFGKPKQTTAYDTRGSIDGPGASYAMQTNSGFTTDLLKSDTMMQ